MGSRNMSETPSDICIVTLRPPTPNWQSLQGEQKAKQRKLKSRHRGRGRGQTDRNTSVCPNSNNGRTGLGQTSACSSSVVNKTSAKSPHRGNQNMQTSVQGGTQGAQSSSSLQCFRCHGWGHMATECTTPAMQLNREGGTEGMQSNPPQIMHSKFKTFPL